MRLHTLAVLAALISVPAGAFEIYSPDMEEHYDTSQNTMAPCDNPGYFTKPPIYDIGACSACQKSIRRSRKEVDGYPDLCQHTHAVEATNASQNSGTSGATQHNQWHTQSSGGNVQQQGSTNERYKRDDAGALREKADACMAAVKCTGPIAPEDIQAGRRQKNACRGLYDGAQQVWEEKNSHLNQMSRLSSTDVSNAGNLSDLTGAKITAGLESMAGTLGAAGTLAGAAAGLFSGSGSNGSGAFLPGSGAFGNSAAGGLFAANGTKSVFAPREGGPVVSWSDYQKLNTLANLKNDGGRTAGLLWAMSAPGKREASGEGASSSSVATPSATSGVPASRPETDAAGGARAGKGQASSDPWLNFISGDAAGSRFVERLRQNPSMREKLRREIREMLADADELTPEQAEKLEFMRKALAQAEAQPRQGTLEQLEALDAREAFSMDADETEREVNRLVASIQGNGPVEDTTRPLFGRVHRALQRQIANGNLGWREMLKARGRR